MGTELLLRLGEHLAVRRAVLQNSVEQVLLALGAHLILATVLRGDELRLIPFLVIMFIVGRVTFALGYARGPGARGFGMAITGASILFAYVLAAALILTGR